MAENLIQQTDEMKSILNNGKISDEETSRILLDLPASVKKRLKILAIYYDTDLKNFAQDILSGIAYKNLPNL